MFYLVGRPTRLNTDAGPVSLGVGHNVSGVVEASSPEAALEKSLACIKREIQRVGPGWKESEIQAKISGSEVILWRGTEKRFFVTFQARPIELWN